MKVGTMLKCAVAIALVAISQVANAWVWIGLKDASPVSGPRIEEKDLIGKVVLVYFFSSDVHDAKLLARTQELYSQRDESRFTVVGSCKDDSGVAELARKHKLAYPIYKDFRVATAMEKTPGTMYFVDEYGRMQYQINDASSLRRLEKALFSAIQRCGQPPSLTDGVSFAHHGTLKDQLVFGRDLSQIEASLWKIVASGRNPSAAAETRSRSVEAQRILDSMGRGMEQMVSNVRVLMDIDIKKAYLFLDLYLKSFPRDKEKYEKLYSELKDRAARAK